MNDLEILVTIFAVASVLGLVWTWIYTRKHRDDKRKG
jgi:hypothetical protein